MTDSLVPDYQSAPQTRRGIYYGWVNLVIAAVAMVATMPGRPQGLGLVTSQLLLDLHVNPVQFATQNLWATLIGSLFSLGIGPLIDRIGARIVLTSILAALGATVVAMSHVTGSIGLLVTLTLTRGFGQSALSVVSLALVGKWFSRRLPLAMGLYSLLVGIGFVVVFGVVGKSVIDSDWRHIWALIGWTILISAAISGLLARSTPESIGVAVDGLADDRNSSADATEEQAGFTLAQALRSTAFWAYALSASIFGMVSAALMLFNQSVLEEHGFDIHVAVNVIIVVTFTGMITNFVAGWIGQKISVGRLMAIGMFLLAISLLCLPAAHGKTVVYAYAVLMGISGGVVTVAFFTCWGKVFGRLHLGSIQGVAQGLTVVTSAAGPWLLANCVHFTHSSAPLFYVLGPTVAALGIFCALAPIPTNTTQARGFPVIGVSGE